MYEWEMHFGPTSCILVYYYWCVCGECIPRRPLAWGGTSTWVQCCKTWCDVWYLSLWRSHLLVRSVPAHSPDSPRYIVLHNAFHTFHYCSTSANYAPRHEVHVEQHKIRGKCSFVQRFQVYIISSFPQIVSCLCLTDIPVRKKRPRKVRCFAHTL